MHGFCTFVFDVGALHSSNDLGPCVFGRGWSCVHLRTLVLCSPLLTLVLPFSCDMDTLTSLSDLST